MCWKHEWARAVNNLEWAKIHIERAKLKVEKRGMDKATRSCEELLETLDNAQMNLKCMIDSFGISKKETAVSLEKHMEGRRVKTGRIVSWVNKY